MLTIKTLTWKEMTVWLLGARVQIQSDQNEIRSRIIFLSLIRSRVSQFCVMLCVSQMLCLIHWFPFSILLHCRSFPGCTVLQYLKLRLCYLPFYLHEACIQQIQFKVTYKRRLKFKLQHNLKHYLEYNLLTGIGRRYWWRSMTKAT